MPSLWLCEAHLWVKLRRVRIQNKCSLPLPFRIRAEMSEIEESLQAAMAMDAQRKQEL